MNVKMLPPFLALLALSSPSLAAIPVIEDPSNVYFSQLTSFRNPRIRVGVPNPNQVHVVVNQTVALQIRASNAPTSYSASGLPAGFTIDQATGVIEGKFAQSASALVTVFAANSDGVGQRSFTMSAFDEAFDVQDPSKLISTAFDTNVVQVFQTGDNLPAAWESGWLIAPDTSGTATGGSFVVGRRGQPDSSTNGLRAYVQGPAQISFRWRTTTEIGFDFLDFTVNGDLEASLSGLTSLTTVTQTLGAGLHQLDWFYVKDGSVSALDQIILDSLTITGFPLWAKGNGMGAFNSDLDSDQDMDGSSLLVEYGLNLNPNKIERNVGPILSFDKQGRLVGTISRNTTAFGVTVDIEANPTLAPLGWSSDALVNVPSGFGKLGKRESAPGVKNFMRASVTANAVD